MLSRIRKAIVAGISAAVSALLAAAIQKGDPRLGWPETLAALALGVAAGVATWRIPNAKTPAGVTLNGVPR